MPSPLAHLIAAGILGKAFEPPAKPLRHRLTIFLLCLFFSFAPDLDVIPGVISGAFANYHNQWTHSILFGLLFCISMSFVFNWIFRDLGWPIIIRIALAGYGIHLGMDFMTQGRGLLLLWPFSETRFGLEPPLFKGLRWSEGFVSPHHLTTIANELLIGAIAAGLFLISRQVRGFSRR